MRVKKSLAWVLVAVMMMSLLTACGSSGPLDPKNPVQISIWHYYNGTQLAAFDNMVREFNQTVGKEQGIQVESFSQGGVNDLAQLVFDVAEGVIGDSDLPDIFAGYADTAYELKEMGLTADLGEYIFQQEIDEYVESFWREGALPPDGVATIFPIGKSSELLQIDAVAWGEFTAAVPSITDGHLATWEGIVEAAQAYYDYTGGRALFGIDSTANYLYVSMRQQGVTLLENRDGVGAINLNEDALRKSFDIYYGSLVRGLFSHVGRYRSDDVKTGEIIGYIGSTTGAMYFPNMITYEDGSNSEADLATYPMPTFQGGDAVAIQQGAGMVVTKSEEKREYAAVEFLKWLTEESQNLRFSVDSAYIPVKREALFGEEMSVLLEELESSDDTGTLYTARMFRTALEQLESHEQFYTDPFPGLYEVRGILESLDSYSLEAREQVVQMMEAGSSYEEAVDSALTEEAFQNWLNVITENTLVYFG